MEPGPGVRERLLQRAIELFAERGYEGASIGALASAAKANRRMIYHYFGDKRGLYAAAFKACWQDLARTLERHAEDRSLLGLLGALFDSMVEQPHFPRLMMWEGLEGGALSRDLWSDTSGPMFAMVEAAIQDQQARGRLDPELHPGHLVVSFLGAVCHYFAYAGSLADLVGAPPLSPPALAERRRQLLLLMASVLDGPAP